MIKLTRLAAVWITLFSFAVESTGAAGLPVLASGPMAARNMMPPPRAALSPGAARSLIGQRVSEGRRFLALGLRELRDDAVVYAGQARAVWNAAQEAFSFEGALKPEALAPIDLPAVPSAPVLPPETRAPAAAFAAGGSIDFVRAPEGGAAARGGPVGVASVVDEVFGLFMGAPAAAVRPDIGDTAEPWVYGKGLRYRVVYRHAIGMSRPDGQGIAYTMGRRRWRENDQVIPARYWTRDYVVYSVDDPKDVRIEIENTGSAAIRGLSFSLQEEEFNPEGGAGRALPMPSVHGKLLELAPGKKAAITGTMGATGRGHVSGHFQQAHARLLASGAKGQSEVLSDEPQAGLVDPPANL